MPNLSKKDKLKNQKILFLITQTKWGGAQKYVLELAEYFSQNNEIHLTYGETDNINQQFLNYCKELKIKTIPIPTLHRKINFTKDFLAIVDTLKILNKENYNLIHLNSSKASFVGSVAAKMYSYNPANTKTRVVYTAHGFVFNEPLSKIRKKAYIFSEKIAAAFQYLIIAVSETDRQSAIDQQICNPNKIFTVHNGLNFDKYNFYSKEEARNKLNLSADKKYFGTIASFYETKGYEYLVEAIKILRNKQSQILKNYQWVLIGEGPNLEKIKKQVADNNLSPYIKFIPAQDNDWKFLKAFDCFILPSIKEGLPYTILEAGLAQIPIIATKVGGLPEIITNEKTGLLITPANPLSLAQAMEKMSQDHDLSEKFAESNYQNIKNNFNLQNTLDKTEELYLKLF